MDKSTVILLVLTFFDLSFGTSIQPSAFCSKNCSCDTEKLIVTCKNIKFENRISDPGYWVFKDDNTSYPFYKVSIQQAGLSSIAQFPNSSVTILDLSMNRIEVIAKNSFMYLQNLTELNLSDNDLTSELFNPDIFTGLYTQDQYLPLKSLKVLNLANNGLHTLHPDIFEHIMNLEILDLHGNPLRVLDSQTVIAIGGLMRLRELDLSYTFLKRIPEHVFHSPKNLEKLNLSGNMLKRIPTDQLEDARSLKFLSLNENPIENITKDSGFPRLEKLKILHLCYLSNLTIIEDDSMAGLWNVEELYISNNPKLSHIGEFALARVEPEAEGHTWPKITKLHLNANHLSHLPSTFLAHWDILTDLDLNDNPWSCDCDNQWVIKDLIKLMIAEKTSPVRPLRLFCAAPPEMQHKNMVDLHKANETMRCLDLDGARPEKDAGILIGILIGLLLGIPMVLGVLFCYKKNFFGFFNRGPAAFSRKFYNPATTEDEFA